jgi:hypothetical protein
MAKARRPATDPASKPAAAKAKGSAAKPVAATAPRTKAKTKRVPDPYDPKHEKPLSELPQLSFPNSAEYEFRVAADERRRVRIRNETILAAVAALVGLVVQLALHSPAFLLLALIAAVAMAGYELIISGIE